MMASARSRTVPRRASAGTTWLTRPIRRALGRGEPAGGDQHFRRAGRADQAHQRCHPVKAVTQPEPGRRNATRPAQNNGLALKPADAAVNVQAIRERTAFLAEDAKVADRPQAPLADVECSGKQVHDANVIATMLAHGVGTAVTMNVTDFAGFERYMSLVEL